jgi:hypothetical protein
LLGTRIAVGAIVAMFWDSWPPRHPTGLVRSRPGADGSQDQTVERVSFPVRRNRLGVLLLTHRTISPARGRRGDRDQSG